MDSIRIFSPATIANISCGFDVLGLALDGVGDFMEVSKSGSPGIRISRITGQDLPLEADKNVAGVAALKMLQSLGSDSGFDIAIEKKIKAGSGIGSSAASAAGAVWAINELLGKPYTPSELVPFAMEGERVASGVAHADNVAPALLGGFSLIRSYSPLDIISIKAPAELHATVIHPLIEVKTSDSRKILKTTLSLQDGIRQWGNLGGLIAGLFMDDYGLIGRSLEDHVVEPIRSILIPGFDRVKAAAIDAGALGGGISGSGPSIFALSRGRDTADRAAAAMRQVYTELDIPFDIHVSAINPKGMKITAIDGKKVGNPEKI